MGSSVDRDSWMKQKQELLKAQKSVSCWVLLYLLLIRLNASQFYVDEKQGFQMRCTGMEPRFLLGTEFYPLESALPCPSESSNRSINDLCLLKRLQCVTVLPPPPPHTPTPPQCDGKHTSSSNWPDAWRSIMALLIPAVAYHNKTILWKCWPWLMWQ